MVANGRQYNKLRRNSTEVKGALVSDIPNFSVDSISNQLSVSGSDSLLKKEAECITGKIPSNFNIPDS